MTLSLSYVRGYRVLVVVTLKRGWDGLHFPASGCRVLSFFVILKKKAGKNCKKLHIEQEFICKDDTESW